MSTPSPELTEKLLIEAGGWQALKEARGILAGGRVLRAEWSPPLLQGLVREGEREYRTGLKIASRTVIDNLCTCRAARERGTVCAHALAVGLAVVAGKMAPVAPAAPAVAATRTLDIPFVADPTAAARLQIILSPNLGAAWEKGQLVTGLELATGPGQPSRLLDPAGRQKIALPLADFQALAGIATALGGSLPGGALLLNREQFAEALESLQGHPRVTLGRATRLSIADTPLRPILRASIAGDRGEVKLEVEWPAPNQRLNAGGKARPWVLQADGRELVPLVAGLPAIYHSLYEKPQILPAGDAAAFLGREWAQLEPYFDLRLDAAPAVVVPALPTMDVEEAAPRFALEIEGSLNELTAKLKPIYGQEGQGSKAGSTARGLAAEQDALHRLNASGFTGPGIDGRLVLRGQEGVLRFFAAELPRLQRDWNVTIGARFKHVSRQIETIVPRIEVRGSGEDWFELDISMTTSSGRGESFPATEIQRLLQMGRSSTRLRDGRLAALPTDSLEELQTALRDCEPEQGRPGLYRIKKIHAGYLNEAFERFGPGVGSGLDAWETWKRAQRQFSKPAAVALPGDLETILRPYQKDGVYWLRFLAENGLAGILADEMGLGKTVQALALLAILKGRPQTEAAPALIICPTSLVENWRREAEHFTSQLRLLIIQGTERAALFGRIAAADLVITSYALIRRDAAKYRALGFSTVILDEAHHIKNPDSQSARAVCALRARHRFVLTGTPIENSVRDLWSIVHFLLPGYLGNRQDFRERYEQPIGRGGAEAGDVQSRLSRRLRPILLRRRKRDVLRELPDKIEQVAYCDLTGAQSAMYRQLLEKSRQKRDDARREKNQARGRMLVLTALLRLRQVCCDLRLLGVAAEKKGEAGHAGTPEDNHPDTQTPGTEEEDLGVTAEDHPAGTSGKLGLLDELLEQIREGGHRVLIFSQFVSMLKLLSAHLEEAAVPFAYLDGQTKDRLSVVDRFQNDSKITAFLISIKAGGVGLNLTAADTVIHFDPWWNPAVEAQATDRAHRLGQRKVVTAYKLIARGTVEEKILDLQRKKREITGALVEPDSDEPLLTTLSQEEIEGLLE